MAVNSGNGNDSAASAGSAGVSAGNGEQEETQHRLQIAKLYFRDVSFEAPGTPQCFRVEWQPQVDVELSSTADLIESDTYDVVLTVTVTARNNEETAYLCEVKQGGVFRIAGFQDDELERILGAYCPTQLFPFAREAINDLVVKGGFPQLLLAPVNFEALYMQQRKQHADDRKLS